VTDRGEDTPVGVVLAGGAARRMGGGKAIALVHGRPLVAWVLDALLAAGLSDRAVAAKADTPLPNELTGIGPVPPWAQDVAVWIEPDEPRHPLAGIRFALGRAAGRAVVVVPVDVPFVESWLLRELAGARDLVIARAGGRVQPLVGRFPTGLELPGEGRATDAVIALGARIVDCNPGMFRNVNTPADVAELSVRPRPPRP